MRIVVPEISELLEAEAKATNPDQRAAIVFSPQGLAIMRKLNSAYLSPLQDELKTVQEEFIRLRRKKMVMEEHLRKLKAFYTLWTEATARNEAFTAPEGDVP